MDAIIMLVEALACLAMNVYHEARGQSLIGQVAVAQVVMNRVKDSRFPNSICEVVKQGQTYAWNPAIPIKHRCQFSWYCDGKPDTISNPEAWETSMFVAKYVHKNKLHTLVEGATHYHAHYVLPAWASSKTLVTRIDDHIFYRWEK